MKALLQRICKLIDVKSIVTFALTALFCYLGACNKIDADKVYSTFLIVMSFYFGTQTKKDDNNRKE